jgi:tetratricopeptide (TPR) repeat protein
MLALLCLALCSAPAGGAEAALATAEEAYYEGRYSDAITALERVVERKDAKPAVQKAALKTIAFCQFLLGDNRAAKEAWLRLLAIDPEYKVDPVEASPEIVRFFERIKPAAAKPASEVITAAPAEPPAAVAPPAGLPAAEPTSERGCGVLLCFVPFGVGQFANGNLAKGALFAGLEALFLGTNVTLYWDRVNEFNRYGGFRDPEAAETKFTLQHVALVLFGVTALAGAVEAYLFP